MLKSAATKVAWVGRTAAMVFGLALVLALVFGAATAALGADGANFILGRGNVATALTRLTGNVDGSAMQVVNTNAGANDSALSLNVQPGEPPMRVSSDAKVASLNADKLDGLDSSQIKGAKTYARVEVAGPGVAPTFDPERTAGFESVSRVAPGQYCLTAADYSSNVSPAVVSVDWVNTASPTSTASAFYHGSGCGYGRFRVLTQRTILSPGGDLSDRFADDVSFVVAVP